MDKAAVVKAAEMKIGRERLICIALAFLSSFSFCIENDTYVTPEKVAGRLGAVLWKLQSAFVQPTYVICMCTILLYFAYRHLLPKLDRKLYKWSISFSCAAALILMLCESYYKYNSWYKVFGSRTSFALSAVRGGGIAILFFFLFQIVNQVKIGLAGNKNGETYGWRDGALIMCVLMLCWLPYIVIMFPGNVCPDTSDEIAQILGNSKYCWTIKRVIPQYTDTLWNNHHPVFYTWILSLFVRLGDVIGSHAWAFELYGILQCACLAAALAYLYICMRDMGVSGRVRKWIMAFFAFNPMFPIWGLTLTKDIPFAIALLISILLFYRFIAVPERVTLKSKVGLGIFLLLLLLFRNNGFYMVLIMLPFVTSLLWKNKRRLAEALVIMALPMLIFQVGVQGVLFQAFHISKGSIREMLSVPFQQTARYVQRYGDALGAEDEENILTILGNGEFSLEELGDLYVPDRADVVKSRYNSRATGEDLINYMKTWGKGLLKHPGVYVEAFLNLNYGWFSFDGEHDFHYYDDYYENISKTKITKMLKDVQKPECLLGMRVIIAEFVELLSKMPFTAWLIQFSFYTWAYLILLFVMLIRKKRQELTACSMIYANYLICFAGPVAYTRYAVPMMVCLPFVAVLAFAEKKEHSEICD